MAWQDTLPEAYVMAGVSCDVDDEYVFLWIARPGLLTAQDIAFLAKECVNKHASTLPDHDGMCLTCGGLGEATLVQNGASITAICPRCLESKQMTHQQDLEQLNLPSKKLPLLYPAALLAGGLAWGVFWNLWAAMFRVLDAKQLLIPSWVVIVLAVGFGFCAGWPIGTVIRRSGAISRFSAGTVSFLATLTIVVMGELLYGIGLAYAISGAFDLGLALQATLPFVLVQIPTYAALKFTFACTLGGAAYEFSKPKTKKMKI
ncbi:hypothetical protein OKA04_16440 [Luteolibacter flavescens]|uniref:Uncharacterized protein n=1 Tax=Luteolibacter flavescens TaxID=1859460 RepID=A0ABT3FRX5_9BACT|nr:hypothetical protein [Luteolibacter flavescens]MCW1886328.1 hypothetical protein [Luteolibacter flavescens]